MKRALLCLALLATALVSLVVVSAVHAAARFARSSPNPGQAVQTSPARVDIYTVRATTPDPLGTQALVLDKDQRQVDTGVTTVDPADHHHFWVDLQPGLAAGRYIVKFKTMGETDFDLDGGAFAFYIGVQPNAADRAADKALSLTTLDDPSTFTGYQRGFVEGGLTLVVAMPAIYYIWQRRKHGKPKDEIELLSGDGS